VFGDGRFQRLAYISNGHLYNLRGSSTYQHLWVNHEKNRPTQVRIGERRSPVTMSASASSLPGWSMTRAASENTIATS